MLHLIGVFKVVHARAAGQQLIEGLRATQEQQPHQHHLRRHQLQHFIDPVLPAICATAHDQARKASPLKCPQALPDLAGAEVHYRLAAGLLIASQHQRIQRQRVRVGVGGLFFDQGAEDANFRAVETGFDVGLVFAVHHVFPVRWKAASLGAVPVPLQAASQRRCNGNSP